MKSKSLFGKLSLAGCALIAAAQIGQAQGLMYQTNAVPVLGPNDVGQLIFNPATTGFPQPSGGVPSGFNYYTDTGHPGSTFTTLANPGGYILNNVWVKTWPGTGAGGAYTASATYTYRFYAINSVTTNSTIIGTYTATYAFSITAPNALGDWMVITNLSLPLSPNTTYAYTVQGSSGYIPLDYTNGAATIGGNMGQRIFSVAAGGGRFVVSTNDVLAQAAAFAVQCSLPTAMAVGSPTASSANPVNVGTTVTLSCGVVVDNAGSGFYQYQWFTDGGGGGALTNIPSATGSTYNFNTAGIAQTNLGNYVFVVKVTDSTSQTRTSSSLTVNVIQVISGALTDLGSPTPPVPGGADAFQLDSAYTYQSSGGLNYYNNATPAMGQTFTTGANAKGYNMDAVAIEMAGGSSGAPYTPGPNVSVAGLTNQAYDLRIYLISQNTGAAIEVADVTNLLFSFANGNWIQWTFPSLALNPNSTYAYTFQDRNTANYCGMSTSDGTQDWYTGGSAVGIPNGGGTVTYSTGLSDGTFDITLLPIGVPFLLSPVTVAPNPVYALSPVTLACRPTTVGPNGYTFTYQWFAEDDLNSIPSTPIPGATGTNATVIPVDLFPGNGNNYAYPTNFYFVATDYTTGNSVTSSIVTLNVYSATAPTMTDPTPASLVTYVGATVTYTAGEVGTMPFTNQWYANYGSGYVSHLAGTNSTLVLANVQTTDSGLYELMTTNLMGHANTDPVSLTVLADPPAPIPASQIYANQVYTNSPWAYWRLNETTNPLTTAIYAYDYSGHGFLSAYGSATTVSNAGPVPPVFPGFDAGELAAGTALATANSDLTVPSLHLNGNSNVTFMAWINPNGAQAANAGLLFYRNGADGAGFGFGGTSHLGYTWNQNSASTSGWDSGLTPVNGQWNFVAYVITPTNTTVYMGNMNGGTNFYQASNPGVNTAETFTGGTILLGSDSGGGNNVRNFNGLICEAALFTNALTTLQVQQYFEAAVGVTSLRPTVPTLTVAPLAAGTPGVYSGQNVRMSAANSSGTFPITNQWQVSVDGSTWVNVSNSNTNSLLINPQVTGTYYYQLVAANIAASVTSSPPVTATFNALPVTPAGQWTINFQTTNNIGPGQSTISGGLGHYSGRGILGNGLYWNPVPQLLGGYSAGNIGSVSDLQDDGATHTGIYCFMGSGGAYNSLGTTGGGTLTYSSDIGNLLDQLYRTYYSGGPGAGALRFYGVPAGTYNLVLYAGNGVTINGAGNLGSTFIVYDAVNTNQTVSTAQATPTTDALSVGLNFCICTNVHVSGGFLNVDVLVNTNVAGSGAIIEGAQLQLVSYDNPPTNSVSVTGTYTPGTATTHPTMALNWTQGTLQSTTNLLTQWTSINAQPPGLAGALGASLSLPPYTITISNNPPTQFFRVQVHP